MNEEIFVKRMLWLAGATFIMTFVGFTLWGIIAGEDIVKYSATGFVGGILLAGVVIYAAGSVINIRRERSQPRPSSHFPEGK